MMKEGVAEGEEKDKIDLIRHIYEWNQKIIQMVDTKVSILLAINAIIILI